MTMGAANDATDYHYAMLARCNFSDRTTMNKEYGQAVNI
jgi:hypothetical protein